MMTKLIVLDRDGVINLDTHYIKTPEEWQPIPGSLEAIAKLHHRGYTVVVATNQSGIGRGFFTEQTLNDIHRKMIHAVHTCGGHIDNIYYCPHLPDDNCRCRKPKTGLFEQIQADYAIDFSTVYAIGDSLRDIQVAQAMNARPILVHTGKGAQTRITHGALLADVPSYPNLWDAMNYL